MKHNWILDEFGRPDEWAWESGYHNGVVCQDCGRRPCVHCEPDWLEMDDCPGSAARNKITNADYIRKMTDEELATLVRAVIKVEDCPAIKDPDCDKCFFRRLCPVGYKYVGRELEWLQQSMED